ncbi:hypothetical protein FS935_00195 [Metabacillus litoralis]|uniref:Uncharacterized protein n=1 Tax=Metabacillus litoralis TaxID=152268 RepID=A0A5C6W9X8_9BACI|nr:hypothetical protein [Metabacillus litoralis]TXC92669.1 hypothetical protein FS935_00195 [Metabacillus litoralis]
MYKNTKFALIASLVVLIGFPVLFILISLFTGQWGYLLWSIIHSFTAGFTGLMITFMQLKKAVFANFVAFTHPKKSAQY